MFGIEQFSAILNPPEVGILSVGKVSEVAGVLDDGSIGVRSKMQVTINADHRAVDGAVGARFLMTLKELLEEPQQLNELRTSEEKNRWDWLPVLIT